MSIKTHSTIVCDGCQKPAVNTKGLSLRTDDLRKFHKPKGWTTLWTTGKDYCPSCTPNFVIPRKDTWRVGIRNDTTAPGKKGRQEVLLAPGVEAPSDVKEIRHAVPQPLPGPFKWLAGEHDTIVITDLRGSFLFSVYPWSYNGRVPNAEETLWMIEKVLKGLNEEPPDNQDPL